MGTCPFLSLVQVRERARWVRKEEEQRFDDMIEKARDVLEVLAPLPSPLPSLCLSVPPSLSDSRTSICVKRA